METMTGDTKHGPYIVCPLCHGRGTQTLHGYAYTADEMDEQGSDFVDNYMSGTYDHPCDHCHSKRVTTEEEWDNYNIMMHEMEMGY